VSEPGTLVQQVPALGLALGGGLRVAVATDHVVLGQLARCLLKVSASTPDMFIRKSYGRTQCCCGDNKKYY